VIARLSGTLVAKSLDGAVVEAGGVGYDVRLPLSAFPRLPEVGQPVTLHIHTHVREDAIQLFGFPGAEDKSVFEMLIGVSGIGPRLALTLLSGLTAAELVGAIAGGRAERLRAVPGVGKKTAERLVVELKDKIPKLPEALRSGAARGAAPPAAAAASPAGEPSAELEDDLLSALVNLGYTRATAEKAIASVRRRGAGPASLADLLRETLRILSS
jgi:Holliday junction DNA helicase RuvA